jgi:hypothetical protein
MHHVLNEKSIDKVGLFKFEAVENIIAEHVSGKRNNDEQIWALMVFMLWYDKFVAKVYATA